MKLIRFADAGEEKPGVVINDLMYDASSFDQDFNENF
jgi:hypothetical protein